MGTLMNPWLIPRRALKLAAIVPVLLLPFAASPSRAASAKSPTSVFSDLAEDKCQTLVSGEEGAYSQQRCPGVAGYRLQVLDDDSGMSVTVEDPAGKEHSLELWSTVSTGFSSLGRKAEWRISPSGDPIALIVRFDASDAEGKKTSFLVVAKISDEGICVVQAVPPGKDANEKARTIADQAARMTCLSSGGATP